MAIGLAQDSVASSVPTSAHTNEAATVDGADALAGTAQATASLGVSDGVLSAEQYAQLDVQGFLILPDVVDPSWLQQMRDRLTELQEREGDSAGHQVRQPGADWLADLLNKGTMFERMLPIPQVLAAVQHVLGDFKVNSLNFRSARPGDGQQELHSDCGELCEDGTYKICNSIWLIDDFTDVNGATRVVPGTHRGGLLPADVLDDPQAPHPAEILLTAAAGTVVIFNSHLWHGGTLNRTQVARRGMTLSFCRRDRVQQLNQAEYIRKQVYDRLSPAERYLMDV